MTSQEKAPSGNQDKKIASPFVKTAILLAVVAFPAAAVQAMAWMLGSEFNVLRSGTGRDVVLFLGIAGTVILMASDGLSAADYGLGIDSRWKKQLLGGLAWGMGTYALYVAVTLLAGASQVTGGGKAYQWFSAAISGVGIFFLALTQQLIFNGYLYGLFARRYGRFSGAIASAVLFTFVTHLEPVAWSWDKLIPCGGTFLIGLFLALSRSHSGNILHSGGMLAGWLFVRKLIRRTDLVRPLTGTGVMTGSGVTWWLFPEGEPRFAPAAWLVVGGACAVLAWKLRRLPKEKSHSGTGVDADFKRYVPFSSPSILAPLDVWLPELVRVKGNVDWPYLPRLLVSLFFSAVNTVVTLPERLLLPLVLRGKKIPPPLFILGVHRSGTTHLHNMLALDPQFVTPRTYHIMNPFGSLFSGWVTTSLLGAFLPGKRPMDDVRFHLFSPQEEEFALMNMTGASPYWGVTFPRRGDEYDRYIFSQELPEQERRQWENCYRSFLKMLVFWRSKRPLLKNPHNTGRAPILLEMFPQAKFIHISRHPYDVYRSNLHMAKEGHCLQQLQDPDAQNSYGARFLENYRRMEEAYDAAASRMGSDQKIDIRFEDVEHDPIGQIEKIYSTLGLTLSEEFRGKLHKYLAGLAGYKKNRFRRMPEEDKRRVYQVMGTYFARWSYEADLPEVNDAPHRDKAA